MTEAGQYVRKGYLIGLLTTALLALIATWGRSMETRIDKVDEAKVDRTEFVEFKNGMTELRSDVREIRRLLDERKP
jgi:hypothetical protein